MPKKKKNSINIISIKPALFVIDVQNCFMAKQGSYDRMGFDISKYQKIIPALEKVVRKFRQLKIPIFFSKAIRETSGQDNLDRVHQILPKRRREVIEKIPLSVKGSWDSQIIDEIEIKKDDFIIEKKRDSAFKGTKLKARLKEIDVDTLIFVGIDTSLCLESTLRDAFDANYDIILLSDATASLKPQHYTNTLKEVSEYFGLVMKSNEFFLRLKKRKFKI